MKLILAFSLLFVAAFAYPAADWEDAFEGIEKRIIGGEAAKPNQFPHQARLHLTKKVNGMVGTVLCGGAIISKRAILTAAHCLHGAIGGSVYLGISNFALKEPTKVVMQLKEELFQIHSKYNPILFENDIGLIILPKAIQFNDAIKPIKLPGPDMGDLQNRMGVISGYGKTEKEPTSDALLFVQRKILDDKICQRAFPFFKPTQICVDGADKKSACPGDSGGPLTVTEADGTLVLVGVTSYGKTTCGQGFPSVYTRISSYLGFVYKYIGLPRQ